MSCAHRFEGRTQSRRLVVVALVIGGSAGCTGTIARSDSTGEAPVVPRAAGEIEASPLRRLSRVEYLNTVRDLLGDAPLSPDDLPADAAGPSGFPASAAASPHDVEQYATAAEVVASAAEAKLTSLVTCDANAGEQACANRFLADAGRRLYRHKLSDEELADLRVVYEDARTAGIDMPGRLRQVLSAALQSPQFLYLAELGREARQPSGPYPVSDHELAARLSYLFTQSAPDAELLALADAGKLGDARVRADQAHRLLATEGARRAIAEFHARWLGYSDLPRLQKNSTTYPSYTAGLRASMRRAADAFVADVVLDGDGTIATLLTSHTAFVDDALAPLYGLAARAGFDKASVDPRRHTGILNEPALLAAAATPNEGSPIRRGRLVREALFCQPVPSAPPTVNTKLPDPVPGQSQRQRYSAHVNDGSCKACHGQMDPIGFGFLKFDGIGAFHDTDAGGPIDSSSELTGTDADGAFSGADELAERMAKSAQVRRCVARQWLRFAFRRNEASDGEDAALSAIAGGFAASAGNVRDLLVDVAQSETFTLRRRIEATQGVKP